MRTAAINERLAGRLDEAGWSPRALAAEINKLFGPGTVSATAPYHWRDSGGVPRAPLPALAAYVLSRQLGRTIEPSHLWPSDAVNETHNAVLATTGMDLPWNPASTIRIAQEWMMTGLTDRRTFLAVSGTALMGAVWAYLVDTLPAGILTAGVHSDGPLITQIEQSISMLQRLDDAAGGAANLNYVGAQLRAVCLVLAEGGHDTSTTRQLMVALADLGQLAGWMAFDANRHGLAQRYLFTALRAAYDAGYHSMAGHILADLSVQATTLCRPGDAVLLGEAAVRTAAASAASVRASVASRLAHAYAGAGRIREFEQARGQALDILEHRNPETDNDPGWMYYLTPNHLDCQAGYSLILIGRRQRGAGDITGGGRTIRDGQRLLLSGAHDLPLSDPSQRRALYEGAWLALGCAARGQLADACAIGRTALNRLAEVRSPRSTALLRQLATDLSRRTRNPDVADFLPELQRAVV